MSKLSDFRDELVAHRITVYANGTNAQAFRAIPMPASATALVQDCVLAHYARVSAADEAIASIDKLVAGGYPTMPAVSGSQALYSAVSGALAGYTITLAAFGTQ